MPDPGGLFSKIYKIIFFAGADKQDYEQVKPRIMESNRRNLSIFTGIASVTIFVMTLLSFIIPILSSSRSTYILCVVASILLFIFANGPAKNDLQLTYVGMYLFSGILLAIGITLGTFIEPNQASASFAILMFALPLWFTDIPIRANLMTISSIVIYFIIASYTQDADMFSFNASVVLPYGVLSIIVCSLEMRMKVSNFVTQYNELMMKEHVEAQQLLSQEMERARDASEAANRAKTAFLFNMSHDIRTPMNAIIGYTQLIEKSRDDREKCDDYLKKIQSSSDFLLSLINNVLEMAKIDSGKTELNEEVQDSLSIMDEVCSVYSELMKDKQITFIHKIDVKTRWIYCDRVKLNEIFLNLVSNAYKYTPEGGRVMLYSREMPSDKPGYLSIQTSISDTGVGMSKEYLSEIFEEFSREHSETETKIKGTGLGMTIVKKLIDLMGGSIEVESELGEGTTIVFTIPHRIASEPRKEEKEEILPLKNFVGKRILLAEDNELNAEISMELLGDCGFAIDRAVDGLICLDMLKSAPAGYYDLILMDIQMPNMDGFEATKAIRKLSDQKKADIPIIAMTANAFEEDKRNSLDSGMNGHISKPFEITKMLEILSVVLK